MTDQTLPQSRGDEGRKFFFVSTPNGYIAGIGFTEAEAWRSAGMGSLQVEFYKERGYFCTQSTIQPQRQASQSWDAERERLQAVVVNAALDLFAHTSTQAFKLPIPSTTPPLFVAAGEEGSFAPSEREAGYGFARCLRSSDGKQVLVHVDIDEEGDYQLVFAAFIDGIVARLGLTFNGDDGKQKAFAALDRAEPSDADTMLSQMRKVIG